jgi:hypothetical protein
LHAALYAPQWPALADGRQILVAETTATTRIAAMVERLLAAAPDRVSRCAGCRWVAMSLSR